MCMFSVVGDLHCVLGGPLPGGAIVPILVSLEKLSNVRDERVVGVGVRQQGADGQQNLRNCQGRAPLVLEDIKADTAVRVDVTVVDTGGEVDLWRLERVVGREVNVQEEHSTSVRGVIRSHDGCLPVEHIIADGAG